MSEPKPYEAVERAARAMERAVAPRAPTVGVILGSGLGAFADTLDDAVAVDYGEIPGFARSTVKGHAGRLVAGRCGDTTVAVLQGRVHAYEGHDLSRVVLPARALVHLGCRTLVITNSAGGIGRGYTPGDLVLIRDHVNLTGRNPLIGDNDDRLGPRFPDMSNAYDRELRGLALRVAQDEGIPLHEGVYTWMVGPSYETPAEIHMARTVGGDLAGMSTVPEVIAAVHMGARVLGISCVTNMAAGMQETLSHAEVKATAERVKGRFVRLLTAVVTELAGATRPGA